MGFDRYAIFCDGQMATEPFDDFHEACEVAGQMTAELGLEHGADEQAAIYEVQRIGFDDALLPYARSDDPDLILVHDHIANVGKRGK